MGMYSCLKEPLLSRHPVCTQSCRGRSSEVWCLVRTLLTYGAREKFKNLDEFRVDQFARLGLIAIVVDSDASCVQVEITCKGQPVVPSLPLQHVRDVIWFSSLDANNNNKEPTSSGEREESTTSASDGQRSRPPASTTDRAATAAGMFSKDILMVLTYRRHPRTLQLSPLLK